jgi:hypothetical protein
MKRTLTIVIKVLIGIGCLYLITSRLQYDLTDEKLQTIKAAAGSSKGIVCILAALLLIPVNWGLEVLKWQVITAPIEPISYARATRSVYAGVCLGNLAPGRATEFIAKVLFFSPENRPQIAGLHFICGAIQLSVTIVAGLCAMVFQLNNFSGETAWMPWAAAILGIGVIAALAWCLMRINTVLKFVVRKFGNETVANNFSYRFGRRGLARIFIFSIVRYAVFFSQFVLILFVFDPRAIGLTIFSQIALFFLLTSLIPMLSMIEAAIRAAVALIVFRNTEISDTALTLSSALLWFVNIIIPSVPGYIFLVRENFNFRMLRNRE